MADCCHLGFFKNSHNFAQHWGIWFKFRMQVQNITLNWITWLKCHLSKIQDGGGRQFGFHKSAISTPWMGGFSSNLVRWCRMTTCSRKRDQNYQFWRNKMVAGAIFDFGKIATTLRRIEGFGSNHSGTLVPAVLTATSQSKGNGQTSTPYRIQTP